MQKGYLQYKLIGFKCLTLKDNKEDYEIDNQYIHSIYFDDKLTVILQDGIFYNEHENEIELYLDYICFNLIIQDGVEIQCPLRRLKIVKDGSNMLMHDCIGINDKLEIETKVPAQNVYQKVVNSPTVITTKHVLYERIFKTLQNPNIIIQFMSLYQFLMELLSDGENRVEQKHVVKYFEANAKKYNFITFKPTRRLNGFWNEDDFTYMRNKIAHIEATNNIDEYRSLGKQISPYLIQKIIIVLNDVIIQKYSLEQPSKI